MTIATHDPVRKTVTEIDSIVSFNVKILLAAHGQSQSALAEALGIGRSAMSLKMGGKTGWSASDLFNASRFLSTSTDNLCDDSLMRRMGVVGMEKAAHDGAASSELLRLGLNQRPSD